MAARWMAIVWCVTTTLSAFPAAAHHSTAEFDYTKAYMVEGTVKEFQWTNPHAWVQMLVPDGKGGTDQWGFELGAPLFNVRMGWNKTSVVAGQKVKVIFCPSRVPARGTLMRLVKPDGTVLNGGAQTFYKGPEITDIDKLAPPPPLKQASP